ncbi:hypothetical protein SSPO_070660 [Streptomyces antimycoticus]|uniref:Major facilitator superfamily (MFS) profile domain-containing protein n=1 Tax=Streptomyces antimycoticus TaxID=68175 RepID=A0A499UWC9_9ACTN|nr:MFS transporter [Streptomyces antimycoticus]BBJ44348.1 hypothetical protein SSPO_070660 [Streptomyces antimycoticus]
MPLLLVGFGTSFTMPSATIAAMEAAPYEVRGAASGAFNAARQLGSAIGVAPFGTLAAASASSAFYAGMWVSAVIAAGCFLGGALLGGGVGARRPRGAQRLCHWGALTRTSGTRSSRRGPSSGTRSSAPHRG